MQVVASLQYTSVNFTVACECYEAKCNTLNYRLQIVQIIKVESVQIELNSKRYLKVIRKFKCLHTSVIYLAVGNSSYRKHTKM